jgi:hypothetical protein
MNIVFNRPTSGPSIPGQPQAARTVPVPFLREPIGAGDVIQRLTHAVGIPQCAPCRARHEALNRLAQFRPWNT